MAKASDIVKQAQSWLGKKEADGSHKVIIDTYNAHKPLARGYKVQCIANGDKRNDAWCATFVSAVAIKCNATNIIPTECGCGEMIALFKKLGTWVGAKSRVPNVGDIIFYDWGGDGWSDHVGIVEKVAGNIITVIEGNYKDAVSRRTIGVNAKNILGYAVPKYDAEKSTNNSTNTNKSTNNSIEVSLTQLKNGSRGDHVKPLQCILVGYGYDCGEDPIDGWFGAKCDSAVRKYQKDHNLTVDGIVGKQTWTSLLK